MAVLSIVLVVAGFQLLIQVNGHEAKASGPIVVTLEGIVIDVKLVHDWKVPSLLLTVASLLIDTILDGIITDVSELQ